MPLVLDAFGSDLEQVKENLNQDLLKLSDWFYEKCMILDPACMIKNSAHDMNHLCWYFFIVCFINA